jgi:hypothetical protein
MSEGGVIMANYFVEDAQVCTITLMPEGDDLEVIAEVNNGEMTRGIIVENLSFQTFILFSTSRREPYNRLICQVLDYTDDLVAGWSDVLQDTAEFAVEVLWDTTVNTAESFKARAQICRRLSEELRSRAGMVPLWSEVRL